MNELQQEFNSIIQQSFRKNKIYFYEIKNY
jgi:hypothetical protein